MNDPREDAASRPLREVQEAYRALPKAEPDAALDARVRAAVAAELATGAKAGAGDARVLVFPWWRRAAVPLATAATVVIAVGVAWLARTERPAPGAPYAVVQSVPEAAPAARSESRADSATQPAPAAGLAAKAARAPAPVQALAPPKAITPPPPLSPAPLAQADVGSAEGQLAEAVATESQRDAQVTPSANAASRGALLAAAPARSRLVEKSAAADSAAASAPGPASLDEVRRLLGEQRREDARALLKRWREAHAGETVPEDLRGLLPERDR